MRRRDKYRPVALLMDNPYKRFGSVRSTVTDFGDIVSADPVLWDCELGIAYHNEDGIPFGYDGKEIDMIEATKHAR